MITTALLGSMQLTIAEEASAAGGAVSPDWWGALAGLHPLVLHFPIALVIVAAFVEFIAMLGRKEQVTSFTVISLVVGGILAVIAAWSGWELAEEGYGSGWALDLHRWLGVATAVLLFALAIIALFTRISDATWTVATTRAGVFVGAVLIALTAHFGGEMVWGGSLLMEALFPEAPGSGATASSEAQEAQQSQPQEGMKVGFTTDVQPILEQHCWKCHGPEGRAKAGLRLTNKTEIMRTMDGKDLIVPGDPAKSFIYEVITLPRDDDHAMPPKGDGLNEREIKVIGDWITEGARFDGSGGVTRPRPTTTTPAPEESAASKDSTRETAAEPPAVTKALKALEARGIPAQLVSQASQDLELNANGLSNRIDPPFGDADMALLDGLQSRLVSIDLSNTAVTDSGVARLAGFDKLVTVKLKDTRTGDGAAAVLAKLPDLAVVNFYGTDLDDAGLKALAGSKSLKTVYAGSSKITDSGVDAVHQVNAALKVVWMPPSNAVAETTEDAVEPGTFKTAIEPILALYCWKCHGEDGKLFRLVTREQLLAKHDDMPIVDPGKPESSLLYQAITKPRDAEGAMPPKGPGLSDAEKSQIKAWIAAGAA